MYCISMREGKIYTFKAAETGAVDQVINVRQQPFLHEISLRPCYYYQLGLEPSQMLNRFLSVSIELPL